MNLNGEFIIVKVLSSNTDIITRIKDSKNKSEKKFYNVSEDDQQNISHLKSSSELKIVFLLFKKNDINYEPYDIYLGKGSFVEKTNDKSKYNLKYQIDYGTNSRLIIDNFVFSSGIDLKEDFDNKCYIITETSVTLYQKLIESLSEHSQDNVSTPKLIYSPHNSDPDGKLSQKNNHCIRVYNHTDSPSEDPRSEFQRDRERILHSKAFRRLVDKAQIFTSKKGDHFRTRMTHTLEVAQISRGIARQLNLNEDLTEAIALAHDIGHTPFGHQGERTLQMLLDKELSRLPDTMKENRRFKHNFQGLRVLNCLEEKYVDFEGLNLSYQVLEGVLKHTKSCPKGKKCNLSLCNHSCVKIEDFLIKGDKSLLFLDYKFPTTLEGQIVRIADEIAQRGHDLDDAFASRLLSYDEFQRICSIKKLTKLKELTEKSMKKANEKENRGFYFIDKHNIIRAELVSSIIGFLIEDVVNNSKNKIDEYDETDELFVEEGRIKELLIDFSPEKKFIVDYLENEISKKVINSQDVVIFDNKSEDIIVNLFNEYLKNPKLLPDSVLRRLFKEIKFAGLDVIDFRDSEISLISSELTKIKLYDHKLSVNVDEDQKYAVKFDKLLHCIIDHVSGMTDNYAINEYNKLKNS